ncbi:MAG: asparagine synthase (glutamine-hydrolyzing), partial [Candidatus Aminicenantes bacterium]|nr:asparagine synthase (glutamine-hydrolyzing) [Candidatus Aminicenantes bacterium]
MCGLTGFWCDGECSHELVNGVALRMAETLVHRGPDDGGIWVDDSAGVALGHRRLAVLDLSPAGRQPMVSASGRFVIVFNGEIYNHMALRRSLGYQKWRGHSDTETFLAAIETWGVERTLKQSVGMFALALWDRQERILTLARDRMGEKPLYYGWQGNTFLFGSELKALKEHPTFRSEIDRAAIALLLRHGAIPAPYSIYQGIYKLLPGTFLQIRSSGKRETLPVSYWSARSVAEKGQRFLFRGSCKEAVDHTEILLREAIAGQMVADVPLGAFLSGGIDSSTVVALMQTQSSRPVKTFTIGFTEAKYNEADHAKVIARRLGCQHTELYVTPQEAMEVIPHLSTIYDEPFADSSQIPTRLVAKLARDQVTVCLTGDGGDEVFGGYDRYFEARKIWRAIGWVPGPLRLVCAGVLTAYLPGAWTAVARILERWLPAAKRSKSWTYKLQTLSDILSAHSPEEIYWQMMSQWKRTDDVVYNTHEPLT